MFVERWQSGARDEGIDVEQWLMFVVVAVYTDSNQDSSR